MRVISCASYYGTGSSAITDLLSEFNNCFSLTNYEFRFVQDPDGISDLEYNLVQNHNRHNSGHALKRYKRLVDFYSGYKWIEKYEPFFNNQWKRISYEYIDQLTDFTYKGWWQYDLLDKGQFFYYKKLLLNKIMHMIIWPKNSERQLNVLPKEITYCSRPSEEKFLNCTRQYIEALLVEANKEDKPNIIVDQIVPPSNLERLIRYFNDIKIFVVDRDPRDLYLLEKYVWCGNVIPTENVEVFCKWYKYTRAHRAIEQFDLNNVMFIQFEDLVYKYEIITQEIIDWLGFVKKDHAFKQKKFKPSDSIKNTRLWRGYPEAVDDIRYIEKELSEYLYMVEND